MDSCFAEKAIVSEGIAGSKSTSEDDPGPGILDTLVVPDKAAEKRLVRKCDLRVVPILVLLYSLAFVDRLNIGNARLQGLEKDLDMKGHDFNIALFAFFIPYILVEVPSNLIFRKAAPSTWLSSLMVLWGIVTVCMGLTKSFSGLVVCRFFLGLFEGGFFPGCTYLITMYYPRHELQWRITILFCAAILGGAWSGLLAYALSNMAGVGGYNGWRWIFIIEGLATVVVAAASKPLIVDWPETAKFLTVEERKLLLHRLHNDGGDARMDRFDSKARRRTFSDWKIYVGVLMYFGVANAGYSTSYFMPTILKELGWTAIRAQVLTIPVYIAATVVTLTTAYLSDRFRHRYGFAMLGIVINSIGFIMLLAQRSLSVGGRYIAIYLITAGGYITQPITLVWLSNNMGGHYKRSINLAMQIGLGNCAGFVASNIFITDQKPLYPVGYGVSLGLMWVCGIACTALLVGLMVENRKRDQGKRDWRLNLPEEERRNLGDDHPGFRFVY